MLQPYSGRRRIRVGRLTGEASRSRAGAIPIRHATRSFRSPDHRPPHVSGGAHGPGCRCTAVIFGPPIRDLRARRPCRRYRLEPASRSGGSL